MSLKSSFPGNEGRPGIAIRVGFVGHRDLGSCDTVVLQGTIRTILNRINQQLKQNNSFWGYSKKLPVCYMINSLAEGADQLAADVSQQLDSQYHLCVPIPFEQEIYTGYFEYQRDQSRETFSRLAGSNTAAVINLNCPHESKQQRGQAYRATADLLLENTDILLAVCDLKRPKEQGGTVETVSRAEQVNIPVILIDPKSPDTAALLICDEEKKRCEFPLDKLEQQVRNILAPHFPEYPDDKPPYYPTIPKQLVPGLKDRFCQYLTGKKGIIAEEEKKREQIEKRERFFREPFVKQTPYACFFALILKWIYRPWWRSIHNIGQATVYIRHFIVRYIDSDQHVCSKAELDVNEPSAIYKQIRALQKPYVKQRELADKLSGFYMDLYRGAFVLNYLMGAMAVLFALLSYFNHVRETMWLWCEVGALALIAINFFADRLWHWNERAIEYRFLAEHFRHMEMLAPLVRVTPRTRMPVHNSQGDPDVTWMNWFFRAVVRENGLVGNEDQREEYLTSKQIVDMSPDYLIQVHGILVREWLEGQRIYHEHVAHRFQFIGKAFFIFTSSLFAVTVAACLMHLLHINLPLEISITEGGEWRPGWLLTIMVAALPAFLAALHGLSKQAEFERLTEHSEAMAEHLERIIKRFSSMHKNEIYSVTLSNLAIDIARMMLEETLEWRVMYLAHETELT